MDSDERLELPQRLVNEYGRVLEERAEAHEILSSQERLPASKEEIKWALLVVAAVGRATGQITDETLEQFCVGYASLADFIPAAEAGGEQRYGEIFRGVELRDDLSREDVVQIVKDMTESGYSSERRHQAINESAHLIVEFRERLAILVEKMSSAQE